MVASANAHCQHRCLYHPSSFKNGKRECQFVIHDREPGRNFSLSSRCFYLVISWPEHLRHCKRLDLNSEAKNPSMAMYTSHPKQTYKRDTNTPPFLNPHDKRLSLKSPFLTSLKISDTEIQIDMGRELSWLSGKWRKIRDLLITVAFHIS